MKIKRTFSIVCLLALGAPAMPAADDVRAITILHTNDLHARLSPNEGGYGGFAYVAAAIRKARSNCTGCLLLNAGDIAQGSPVSTIFHGLPVWEIVNRFGYDASTLGNHDFDYGWMQARKFVQTAKFPVVMANISNDDGQLFVKRPFVVLRTNGVRVAVIGAMTDDFRNLTTPALRGPWHTTPVLEAVRRYAHEARARADLVVVLAHITPAEENALLKLGPETPVIISGHAHNGMPAPIVEDGRVAARVKAYGEEIGRLELKVNLTKKALAGWDWQHLPVDSRKLQPNPKVASDVKRWESQVSRIVDRPLATSEKEFSRAEVRVLLERAMRDETGADFAFVNSGGVRDSLPKGQLLLRHAWNVMPFDNRVVIGTFKGRTLPPAVASGHAVEPDREYTLAVSDFTADNQSAPSQLGTTGLLFPRHGPLLRDVLIDWIRKQRVLK
ncbi:MAG TPA: bifunctional UDP-sugar hydrolase/5'-nucleotidase [Bryobacteraceae bacterium]|nr:bifunctional UDP-sugar hydrolase/5'-nucleotidase [Bryobacteraceae bacterium]